MFLQCLGAAHVRDEIMQAIAKSAQLGGALDDRLVLERHRRRVLAHLRAAPQERRQVGGEVRVVGDTLGQRLADASDESDDPVVVKCTGDRITILATGVDKAPRSYRTDLASTSPSVRPRIVAIALIIR